VKEDVRTVDARNEEQLWAKALQPPVDIGPRHTDLEQVGFGTRGGKDYGEY